MGSGADVRKRKDGQNGNDSPKYFFFKPAEDIRTFLKSLRHLRPRNVTTNLSWEEQEEMWTWRNILSTRLINILLLFSGVLASIGRWVELPGNIWNANGGSLKLLMKRFLKCEFVIPRKNEPMYHSLISQMDPRKDLWVDESAAGHAKSDAATDTIFPGTDAGARCTADVLVLASKLAYENAAVVEDVVTNVWKMHFVDFYDCWNEFQGINNTQVFVFTDKEVDAKAIVVAWRGTEPFNSMDWCTDLEFSGFSLGKMGKVHVGFLEALGLVTRKQWTTFETLQHKCEDNFNNTSEECESTSGLKEDVIKDEHKILAYDKVNAVVKDLLSDHKHPNARVYVTGHSLGGALAAVYIGMLHYTDEKSILKKLAAVYTFGQPRVADEQFASFMKTARDKLEAEIHYRYSFFRVVYCNDVVPRVPCDDDIFGYKHFERCFYYDNRYTGRCMDEAPGKYYFYVSDFCTARVIALRELMRALRRPVHPDSAESWASIIMRVIALLLPGVGSHSIVNYVHAVRFGPAPLLLDEGPKVDESLHHLEDTFRTKFLMRLWKAVAA